MIPRRWMSAYVVASLGVLVTAFAAVVCGAGSAVLAWMLLATALVVAPTLPSRGAD
jgi:hypothetical protein